MFFSKQLLMAVSSGGEMEWTTPGTYSITFDRQVTAKIEIIGGGGNSFTYNYGGALTMNWSGASGAGYVGKLLLSAGTYSVVVGGASGTSSFGSYITAGGGETADSSYYHTLTFETDPAEGGVLTITAGAPIVSGSTTLQTDGNDGLYGLRASSLTGGASVYNNHGRGGDYPSSGNRTNGYVKLTW